MLRKASVQLLKQPLGPANIRPNSTARRQSAGTSNHHFPNTFILPFAGNESPSSVIATRYRRTSH